jgi:Domain of unknown function (DUF4062)
VSGFAFWVTVHSIIDESDVFLLILGARYGTIAPVSHKSNIQIEYEYACDIDDRMWEGWS